MKCEYCGAELEIENVLEVSDVIIHTDLICSGKKYLMQITDNGDLVWFECVD